MRKIILVSALPEILAGIRIGVIRGVKGVVGQILVAVIGYGELFGLYSRSFVENAEKRIEYYAGTR